MKELIDKSEIVAEIKKRIKEHHSGYLVCLKDILSFLDTLEVKEIDLEKERIKDCPYKVVGGCGRYQGTITECNSACGWIVDHLNLKELKTKKGE